MCYFPFTFYSFPHVCLFFTFLHLFTSSSFLYFWFGQFCSSILKICRPINLSIKVYRKWTELNSNRHSDILYSLLSASWMWRFAAFLFFTKQATWKQFFFFCHFLIFYRRHDWAGQENNDVNSASCETSLHFQHTADNSQDLFPFPLNASCLVVAVNFGPVRLPSTESGSSACRTDSHFIDEKQTNNKSRQSAE